MSWNEITVLVEKAKTGDREAYGELVTRFQSSVYAMALTRVRDPLEAQELAQDVFVHAMRKLPQLRDARCFAGWLRRITARMAINRLTRRGVLFGADPEMLDAVAGRGRTPDQEYEVREAVGQLRDPRCFAGWLRRITARMAINRLTRRGPVAGAEPDLLENVEGRVRGPVEEIERTEAKAELHAGLKRLKDLDRQTLEAFYLRGRSLKQMAREFDVPTGTIKRRLHVARQRLKDVLEGRESREDREELLAV